MKYTVTLFICDEPNQEREFASLSKAKAFAKQHVASMPTYKSGRWDELRFKSNSSGTQFTLYAQKDTFGYNGWHRTKRVVGYVECKSETQ